VALSGTDPAAVGDGGPDLDTGINAGVNLGYERDPDGDPDVASAELGGRAQSFRDAPGAGEVVVGSVLP
jgi:hypothetical protein